MDLISLSDGDNSLRVRVLGRHSPGLLHLHDQLDAEVLVTSSFATGRLTMPLILSDLEDWSRALDELAAGQDVFWSEDHSPQIRIQPHNGRTAPADEGASQGEEGFVDVVTDLPTDPQSAEACSAYQETVTTPPQSFRLHAPARHQPPA